eukprot:scaffold91376_cov45-Prasinocladus_malaysianus.AAC.1
MPNTDNANNPEILDRLRDACEVVDTLDPQVQPGQTIHHISTGCATFKGLDSSDWFIKGDARGYAGQSMMTTDVLMFVVSGPR